MKLLPYSSAVTLWQWICTRLLSLVIGCTLAITAVMWLRYYIPGKLISNRITSEDKKELSHLIDNPSADIHRYHELIDKWYGASYSDPSMNSADWILVLLLILITIPVIVTITLRAVKPLTQHIIALVEFTRKVSEGSFGIQIKPSSLLPSELYGLTKTLNLMSSQLERYDRELKASHAAMAHELRSPLTASMGRLQGMIDGIFPASREQLSMVMKQLHDINHLVDDLHLLSLADAGHLFLNYQNISLDEVIEEKISWLRPRLIGMDFSIKTYAESKVFLSADHFRIGQVISILLDNAIKYAAEGKRLDIRYGKNSGMVYVLVIDYGEGVSEEFFKDLFIRFSRADESRSRNSVGSGLGLSIAKAICEAHGGNMHATRNEHGGLTFSFTVPSNDPVIKQ